MFDFLPATVSMWLYLWGCVLSFVVGGVAGSLFLNRKPPRSSG